MTTDGGTSIRTWWKSLQKYGREEDVDASEHEGVRDKVVTPCAVMVYSLLWFYGDCAKKLKHGDERAETRWLWLGEKAILVWARLMEVMLMVGDIVGTVRSET